MGQLSLDDRNPMLTWEQASELVGDHLPADAAAQDDKGLCVWHGLVLS
jgi:hypothetical protein